MGSATQKGDAFHMPMSSGRSRLEPRVPPRERLHTSRYRFYPEDDMNGS